MRKILPGALALLLLIACLLPPAARAESVQTFSVYPLYTRDMSIELPDGWYMNTQNAIDPDFLSVSANSQYKLKKYLTQQHVEYNLVSKDLKTELNVIVLHNSRTKLIYNYNDADPAKLEDQIANLVEAGVTTSKAGETTYSSGRLDMKDSCLFIVLEGKMEEESASSILVQYSTIVNGFGINISIKSYDETLADQNAALIEQVAGSFRVAEVKEGNRTLQIIVEFLPPILLVLGFIGFAVYRVVAQVRKNRMKDKEA